MLTLINNGDGHSNQEPQSDALRAQLCATRLDFSLMKDTKVRENLTLQFRWEMFNALNRVQFGNPDINPASATYGNISSQANAPRSMQMALRLMW